MALIADGQNAQLRGHWAFLAARPGGPDPQALYTVYGGGNDLLAADHAADRDAVAQGAAAAIGGIVADLATAGAAAILVPNLPDIGLTPALRAQGPAAVAAARALTRAYNAALERELARVASRHRAARVHRLDVFARDLAARSSAWVGGNAEARWPMAGTEHHLDRG